MVGLSYYKYKYVTKLVKKIKLNTTHILRILVVFNIIFFTRFITLTSPRIVHVTECLLTRSSLNRIYVYVQDIHRRLRAAAIKYFNLYEYDYTTITIKFDGSFQYFVPSS